MQSVMEKKEVREESGEEVFRPFHETIVDVIEGCMAFGGRDINPLLKLIHWTKIPKGHDRLISEIDHVVESFLSFNPTLYVLNKEDLCRAREILIEQKQAAEKEQAKKKESLNLDELQREVECLLSLLVDRHRGKVSWKFIMQDHLQKLHKLTSPTLGES